MSDTKRFISSGLWDDPSFIDLNDRQRLFFVYLWTNFDLSGVVQLNTRIDKVYLGFDIDDRFVNSFVEKVNKDRERIIRIRGNRLWLPEWVRFQQTGKKPCLSIASGVHKRVVSLLNQHGLYAEALAKDPDLYSEFDEPQKPGFNTSNSLSSDYRYPCGNGKSSGGDGGSITKRKYNPEDFAKSFR